MQLLSHLRILLEYRFIRQTQIFTSVFLYLVDDLEINDGSSARPYRMTKELRKLLHKKNHSNSNDMYRELSED